MLLMKMLLDEILYLLQAYLIIIKYPNFAIFFDPKF